MNKPNKYQEKILDCIQNEKSNILVSARAGCGKTSTLVMISDLLEEGSMFLAFNKSIAEELKVKIKNDKVSIFTINALGNKILQTDYYQRKHDRVKVDGYKFNNIVKDEFYKEYNDLRLFIKGKYVNMIKNDLLNYCNSLRINAIDFEDIDAKDIYFKKIELDMNKDIGIIEKYGNSGFIKRFSLDDDSKKSEIYYIDAYKLGINYNKLVKRIIQKDIEDYEKRGIIDFTDQIYLPNILNIKIPNDIREQSHNILGDESQDMNRAQHLLLKKLYNPLYNTRYIFVGDDRQAIYGFAGADCHSIENLKNMFNLKELPLNCCYRCPKTHIELAQKIVGDIEAYENNKDGLVEELKEKEMYEKVQCGDYIISRKNKYLTECALNIIKNNKPVMFLKFDISKALCSFVDNKDATTVNELINSINDELEILQEESKEAKIKFNNGNAKIIDKIEEISDEIDNLETIALLVNNYIQENKDNKSKNVSSLFSYVKSLFVTNPDLPHILVSTVHKVKGSETNNVFIIKHDEFPYTNDFMKEDQIKQELNLQYIAYTRAKDNLYLCN